MQFVFRALLKWLTPGRLTGQVRVRHEHHNSFSSLKKQFTPLGKRILKRAEAEARRWNHEYIGTEHLLLGLLIEDDCTTANLLRAFNANARQLVLRVVRLISSGPDAVTLVRLRLLPQVRKAIHNASAAVHASGGKKVEAKHLLLALLSDSESLAYHVFKSSGIEPDGARHWLLGLG